MTRFQSLSRSQQLSLLLYALVALVLWGFVWAHAFGMDMTHDEAYSYRLVKTNYFIAMFGTANTHWLNTIFMEVFNNLFGDGPGWLRLHSVLAFPFFAWALYRLGNLIKIRAGAIVFWALVLFNPFVLDFFSLARGYGLAMTFQAWSLYYFVKAAQSPTFNYRGWLMVWLMNALAIGANLSYFYSVIGMAGFLASMLLAKILSRQVVGKPLTRIFLLYILLLLGAVADLLFIKYYGKDLDFGGNADLIGSLMGSMWRGSLYNGPYGQLLPVLQYASFYLLLLIIGWYVWSLIRTKKISTGLLLSIPLISILILNIVFHAIFQTPYLYSRTALQWYVPGLLLIYFAAGEGLPAIKGLRLAGMGLAVVILLLAMTHFYYRADKRVCFEWQQQIGSKQAIYDLYAQQPRHPFVGFATGGVYKNYYILLSDQFEPFPGDLPDQIPDSAAPALRAALQKSDYLLTDYAVTLQCLQQLGLKYEVLKTYPPGANKLIRIYH